jgi:hypothetical protein
MIGYFPINECKHGAANMRLIWGKMVKLAHFRFRRMFMVAQLIGV